MARDLGDEPDNYDDAVYMLDRNLISVSGAKTREEALAVLREEYGDDDGSEPDVEDDYDNMKVAELRDLLNDRDLDTDGNKDELITRLREDDAEEF